MPSNTMISQGPVVVSAAKQASAGAPTRPGSPARYQVWLDPIDARIAEVASAMCLSVGAVKFHMNQGRERLRPNLVGAD